MPTSESIWRRALIMINWAVTRKKRRIFWRRRMRSSVRRQILRTPGRPPSRSNRSRGRTTLPEIGRSTRKILTSPAVPRSSCKSSNSARNFPIWQDAQQEQSEPGPDNASGNWTIYAQNIDQPGGSTKFVQIQQFGTQLSGHFKGPHQSGEIKGFVNVHHIEFSTHTRDMLTFRGQIQGNTMSGLYGMHGQHAPWNAVRSD